MTDTDDIYPEGGEPRLVIRLSRTATGTRTYTVGASMPVSPDRDGETIARLFAVDEVVRRLLDGSGKAVDETPEVPRKADGMLPLLNAGQWYTTPELGTALGIKRSTLRGLLNDLKRRGLLDYQRGTGRTRPSRYRLSQPVTVTEKGKVQA